MSEANGLLRQEERTDAARRRLIAATIEVLATEGYRKTTFTRIQEVAGISRGLIGYHFGTKQALIEAVVTAIRLRYREQTQGRTPGEQSGLAEVANTIDTYLSRLSRDPAPAKVMLVLGTESIGEQRGIRDAVREGYAEMRRELRGVLERGVSDGSVRPGLDTSAHAGILEALLRGTVLQYLVDPEGFDLASARVAAAETVAALAAAPQRRRDRRTGPEPAPHRSRQPNHTR